MQKPTFAAHVLMFRLGPEGGMSLKRVEVEEEDGSESEGEGTGSTELSDIRLLGRCGEKETRLFLVFHLCFCGVLVMKWMQRGGTRLTSSSDNLLVTTANLHHISQTSTKTSLV